MHSFSLRRLFSGLASVVLLVTPSYAATNTTINPQVRLAYAGNTGMYVSWNTFVQLSNPTVKHGLTTAMTQSVAVVDMGTMGPQGLTTTAGTGVAKTNVLGPKDNDTIQSLAAVVNQYEFLWHRKSLPNPA
jgi:hypothetical protein